MRNEEEQAVRIAMDDARDRGIPVLLERVGLAGVRLELGDVGHHLAPHGVAPLLDQTGVVGRDLDLELAGDAPHLVQVQSEPLGDLLGFPETALQNPLPVVHVSSSSFTSCAWYR